MVGGGSSVHESCQFSSNTANSFVMREIMLVRKHQFNHYQIESNCKDEKGEKYLTLHKLRMPNCSKSLLALITSVLHPTTELETSTSFSLVICIAHRFCYLVQALNQLTHDDFCQIVCISRCVEGSFPLNLSTNFEIYQSSE